MTRSALLTAALVAIATAPSFAQPQPPMVVQRPTFSPYLNLVRGGTAPGINYLGLVRPQLQFQQQFGQLQTQLQQTNRDVQQLNSEGVYGADPNLPLTGHLATFNNTGHYFRSNPALGGFGGLGGATGVGGVGGVGTQRFGGVGIGVGGLTGGGMGQLPRPNMGGFAGVGGRPAAGGFGAGVGRPSVGGVGGFGPRR